VARAANTLLPASYRSAGFGHTALYLHLNLFGCALEIELESNSISATK